MAVSKAQQRAVTKYDAKAYDKTLLRLPKGKLDVVKAHATARSESVNGFISRAILEAMERDGGGNTVVNHDGSSGAAAPGTAPVGRVLTEMPAGRPQEAAETSAGAGVVFLPSDTLEAAERAAKRTGETVAAFVARAVADQKKRDDRSFQMGINPA